MTYRYILSAFFLCLVGNLMSQTAWIEPDPTSADFNPNAPATIYVDAKKTECPDLADFTEMYMWTWNPAELPAGDENHNGTWDESNESLQMTAEGDGIFSYTMTPTEFYKVDAATVYEKDFSFLIKLRNGAGGATTCNEDKSEDLSVTAEPFVFDRKVYSFPDTNKDTLATDASDFFTLIYNRNLEEKESLLDTEDYNVFLKFIGDDGKTYVYASPGDLDDFPELKLNNRGDGVYLWTIQPSVLMRSGNQPVPEEVGLTSLRLEIAKSGAMNRDDIVDGTFDFVYKCQ